MSMNGFNSSNHRLSEGLAGLLERKGATEILFAAILLLGIFARTWGFRTLPPGLNSDEASIGVEAFDLSHYGVDRNGISYPIHFISWGSGQNALYGYMLIPFIALLGLSPLVVRLPMLLTGILSLPLVYVVGKGLLHSRFGLLSMFFVAISPWHILLSRWGLESNILPFVFLAGFACLVQALQDARWFIPACALFALSLYAYGTAYIAIPLFLALSLVVLSRAKAVPGRYLFGGTLVFVILSIPIGLFLLVNTLKWNSIGIGSLTIPRLPVAARFQTETIASASAPLVVIGQNFWSLLKLLIVQSDGLAYNVIDPYGYFYAITFPVALAGIVLLARGDLGVSRMPAALLLSWLASAGSIGLLQSANINRLNILFIPLILCIAFCIVSISSRYSRMLPLVVLLSLLAFLGFTIAYHGPGYRAQADWKFHSGLLPAINFARAQEDAPVCISDGLNMPYIFALFSERPSPQSFLSTVRYADATAPLRQVLSFGRYTFGKANCSGDRGYVYVMIAGETPAHLGTRYGYRFFDNFVVYYPKP